MSAEPAIGVLVPVDPGTPLPPPEARPIGRAALVLAKQGLRVVFGDEVRDGRMSEWRRSSLRRRVESLSVLALHDRYRASDGQPGSRRSFRLPDRSPSETAVVHHAVRDSFGAPAGTGSGRHSRSAAVEADPRFAGVLETWGSRGTGRSGSGSAGSRRPASHGTSVPCRDARTRSSNGRCRRLRVGEGGASGWSANGNLVEAGYSGSPPSGGTAATRSSTPLAERRLRRVGMSWVGPRAPQWQTWRDG